MEGMQENARMTRNQIICGLPTLVTPVAKYLFALTSKAIPRMEIKSPLKLTTS
jgi:hypothetical protein